MRHTNCAKERLSAALPCCRVDYRGPCRDKVQRLFSCTFSRVVLLWTLKPKHGTPPPLNLRAHRTSTLQARSVWMRRRVVCFDVSVRALAWRGVVLAHCCVCPPYPKPLSHTVFGQCSWLATGRRRPPSPCRLGNERALLKEPAFECMWQAAPRLGVRWSVTPFDQCLVFARAVKGVMEATRDKP